MELLTHRDRTPVRRWKRKAPPTTWIGTAALVLLLAWPVVARGLPHQSGSIAALPTLKPQADLCTAEGTDVSGTLSGTPTWTKANSPYHVTADVTIALDGQLTIEAGVVVCFAQDTGLHIGNGDSAGRLVAVGNTDEPIVFTADTETPARGYWRGIAFSDGSQRNSMGYCVLEYASTGVSSTDSVDGMEIDDIHHCIFRHNGVVGDGDGSGGALNFQGDGLSLWRNKIYDNELGVQLAESFNDEILENEIYDNDGYGLALVAEGASPAETNLISGNQIYNNGGDGIWITDQSALQAIGNTGSGSDGNEPTYDVRALALAEIHDNVLCGNTGSNLRNQLASEIQATGNWFGTNTPGVNGKIEGSVDFDPWIEMDVTVEPTQLLANGISTADFALTMVDGDGHAVPDGYEVTVTANLGSLSDPTLFLNSGQATTTYTAGTVAGGVSFGVTDQHQCSTLSFPGELTLEPLAELDLSANKDDGAGLVPQLSPDKKYLITYNVTYANTGGIDASGVVLTDDLPDGTQVYANNGWTCTNGLCTHSVGLLPVGSSGTAPPLVVEVLPDSITGCPDLRNTVTISDDGSNGPDSNPDDNSFPLDTELPCLPDLVLKKSNNLAGCVEVGEQITYELAYTNAGFAEATGVVLTEQIPDHTSYAGSGWTCDDSTCTRSVSNVPKGGQGSVEFVVVVTDPTPSEKIANTADIDSQEADLEPADNKAQEKTLVCPDIVRPFVQDVAVNAETNRVYVANPVNNAVLVVDPSGSRSVIASIPVGDYPLGLDVVTTNNKIYAANSQDGTVTAIRGSDNTPIVDRYVGAGASKVATDSADERVYVANHGETNKGAAAINSQTDEFEYYYGRLQGAQGRYGLDVDPERNQLFIAARDAGLIAIQDAYSPEQDPQLVKLDPPRVPYVVAFNPATNHLFVTAPDDNKVVVLAPYSIQWQRGAWLTQRGGQRVLLLDRTNAGWIKEIDVGQGAEEGIAVNPLTGYVYVTNAASNTVSVLQDDADPAKIQWIEDITVGVQPQGVDVDTKTNTIYVGNAGSRDLTVIEFDGTAHTVARTIPLD